MNQLHAFAPEEVPGSVTEGQLQFEALLMLTALRMAVAKTMATFSGPNTAPRSWDSESQVFCEDNQLPIPSFRSCRKELEHARLGSFRCRFLTVFPSGATQVRIEVRIPS